MFRYLKKISISVGVCGFIVACNSGESKQNSISLGQIDVSTELSTVTAGVSLPVTITLNNSNNVTNPIIITAMSSSSDVLRPPVQNNCQLTTNNNSCLLVFTSIAAGTANVIITAANYSTTQSSTITVIPIKYVFVSVSAPQGNMIVESQLWSTESGIAGADQICAHDAANKPYGVNIPTDSNWKAMLVNGQTRASPISSPPNGQDWVFESNTKYIDIISGKTIGITESNAIFNFPFQNPWGVGAPYPKDTLEVVIYDGMDEKWQTLAPEYSCLGYTTTIGHSGYARVGVSYYRGQIITDSRMIANGDRTCSLTSNILCVQQ